ncbi:MAG: serine hydrolase domain-containing protein [Cellulomonadaceae bacterium]
MMLDPDVINQAVDAGTFSGVVTVDVGDQRAFERVRGYAHRAFAVPLRADMQLAMASGSKTFTALAILRLVEQGALTLDTRVRELLGNDLPLIDDAVTIEHLLAHTSGIGDYLDEDELEVTDYVLGAPVHTLTTAESMIPMLDGFAQVFAPGERYAYTNGGFVVLGVVLERLTAESFQDATRRLVLEPAGLRSTGYLRLDELPGTAAVGYLFDEGDRVNTLHLPVRGSADGGAFTTAADLHRFWRALLDGTIVRPDTVAQMLRPRHEDPEELLRYGLGVYVHETGRAVGLVGGDAGVSFISTHLPELDTTVSVLGNSSEGGWSVAGTVSRAVNAWIDAH